MKSSILIFPAGMPRSLEYSDKCRHQGQSVIGASSLAYDPAREHYSAWAHLPYITDPAFNEALKQVVAKFDINAIYTPNLAVWSYLDQALSDLLPNITLVNDSPVDEALAGYRTALAKARALDAHRFSLASVNPARPPLTEIETAALIRYADLIPGMCDGDKLRVLIEIARYAVQGDVVEIGSWWGKSAYILAQLAKSHGIGNLLCVDPWGDEHLVQNETIVDQASAQVDAHEALTIFQVGLIPFNSYHINYLRMTSVTAALYYQNNKSVYTATFGRTEYTGQIALLHIDGNHGYESVKADIESWGKYVVNGGWIVFDDYIWPFGDGPKRVGDAYLAAHHDRIAAAFVMGSALFLQVSSQRA